MIGNGRIASGAAAAGTLLAALLIVLLVLPLLALPVSLSFEDFGNGLSSPLFLPALALSVRTTVVSLAVVLTAGTPLAWWLATSASRASRVVGVLVDLPIVMPPAVIGVGLLQAFGTRGMLGPALTRVGLALPFTEAAVLLAQVVVSAPFFVQAAANAFRKVEPDMLTVARTLGASPPAAFFRVAVPLAAPGLVAGASLAWARALGEFGATLLFAGNLPGRTQTMPLAIFAALERDVHVAVVFSLMLAAVGAVLLLLVRGLPMAWSARSSVARSPAAGAR